MAESKEELKSLLMKVKKDSEKAGLKLNIWKTKIMASSPFSSVQSLSRVRLFATRLSPITSWQIGGETMKTVTDFIFLGSKITAAGDYSYEIRDVRSLEEKLGQT